MCRSSLFSSFFLCLLCRYGETLWFESESSRRPLNGLNPFEKQGPAPPVESNFEEGGGPGPGFNVDFRNGGNPCPLVQPLSLDGENHTPCRLQLYHCLHGLRFPTAY